MLRAGGYGYVAAICYADQFKGVFQPLLAVDVAGNYGERFDFEFGRVQGQEDGHGIVGAGIGVDDDALLRSL